MTHDALRMRLRRMCEIKARSKKCHVDDETHKQYMKGGEGREWLEIALAEAIERLETSTKNSGPLVTKILPPLVHVIQLRTCWCHPSCFHQSLELRGWICSTRSGGPGKDGNEGEGNHRHVADGRQDEKVRRLLTDTWLHISTNITICFRNNQSLYTHHVLSSHEFPIHWGNPSGQSLRIAPSFHKRWFGGCGMFNSSAHADTFDWETCTHEACWKLVVVMADNGNTTPTFGNISWRRRPSKRSNNQNCESSKRFPIVETLSCKQQHTMCWVHKWWWCATITHLLKQHVWSSLPRWQPWRNPFQPRVSWSLQMKLAWHRKLRKWVRRWGYFPDWISELSWCNFNQGTCVHDGYFQFHNHTLSPWIVASHLKSHCM